MTEIINLPIRGWHEACPEHTRALAIGALERGDILSYFPRVFRRNCA